MLLPKDVECSFLENAKQKNVRYHGVLCKNLVEKGFASGELLNIVLWIEWYFPRFAPSGASL